MAQYALTNGYNVAAVTKGNKGREFTTTNPEGDVISTVTLFGEDARELERDLIIANRLASL